MRLISFLLVVVSFFQVNATPISDWYNQQKQVSLRYLLENISRVDTPRGFVVASPSKHDPNYYYHWVRDAALVMRALDKALPISPEKDLLFHDYIRLISHHQVVHKLTDMGEPKFNPDGTSFSGPWGRPQNDGPALRAITLIYHAFSMINRGHVNYVRQHLYKGAFPAEGVIKKDLEYVSHNWQYPDFDLWEEVKGHHFYTRMVQRTALYLGGQLAEALGDARASKWYYEQAAYINASLDSFYSEQHGYILTTLNQVDGLPYKHSNLDASVILAVNHAWIPGMSFGPNDPRVMQTFNKLTDVFRQVYPINQNGQPGVAIGRYPEDQYFGGNPWFLLTNAMAEYLYKLSATMDSAPNGKQQIQYMADGFLIRVRSHMGADGRMDEQIDKHTGFMKSARDLTWSYASFLTVK